MKYRVWRPDFAGSRDDATRVSADSISQAVERYCAWDDSRSAEYESFREVTACEDAPNSKEIRFTVELRSEPVYRARATVENCDTLAPLGRSDDSRDYPQGGDQ